MAKKNRYYERAERDYRKADYDWAMMKDGGRRRREMEDSYMINEDRNAIANLPQEAFMKKYPQNPYNPSDLDDTIRGVDRQIDADHSEMMRHRKPEKY